MEDVFDCGTSDGEGVYAGVIIEVVVFFFDDGFFEQGRYFSEFSFHAPLLVGGKVGV